jgi:nitroreductase
VRKFKAENVKESDLDAILDCGVYAASGAGKQSGLIVALENKADMAEVEKLNAKVMGNPSAHTFYGAPMVAIVFADATIPTWVDDGNMIIGNMLNAAHALGLGSCYIYRAREVFDSPEGKALMKKWGVDPKYRGVGNVILGYPDDNPKPAPRKQGYIVKVK